MSNIAAEVAQASIQKLLDRGWVKAKQTQFKYRGAIRAIEITYVYGEVTATIIPLNERGADVTHGDVTRVRGHDHDFVNVVSNLADAIEIDTFARQA